MSKKRERDPALQAGIRALLYIKVARLQSTDDRSMMGRPEFLEQVIKPLESVLGWTEEDEKAAREAANKLDVEGHGKGLKEKSTMLTTITKLASIAAGAALVGLGARRMIKKSLSRDEDAE